MAPALLSTFHLPLRPFTSRAAVCSWCDGKGWSVVPGELRNGPGSQCSPSRPLALHRLEGKSGSGWAWKITKDTCCPHWFLNFMTSSCWCAILTPVWLPGLHSRVSFRSPVVATSCASLATTMEDPGLRGCWMWGVFIQLWVWALRSISAGSQLLQLLHLRNPDTTMGWPDHSHDQALHPVLRHWDWGGPGGDVGFPGFTWDPVPALLTYHTLWKVLSDHSMSQGLSSEDNYSLEWKTVD